MVPFRAARANGTKSAAGAGCGRLGDPSSPGREGRPFGHTHRAVPKDGVGPAEYRGETLGGLGADVETHGVIGNRRRRDQAVRRVGGKFVTRNEIDRQRDLPPERRGEHRADVLDEVRFHQGVADGIPLSFQKREAHGSSHQHHVDLGQQCLDHPELARNLGPSQHDDERALRCAEETFEGGDFGQEERARCRREKLGHPDGGGVSPVGRAECVEDE